MWHMGAVGQGLVVLGGLLLMRGLLGCLVLGSGHPSDSVETDGPDETGGQGDSTVLATERAEFV